MSKKTITIEEYYLMSKRLSILKKWSLASIWLFILSLITLIVLISNPYWWIPLIIIGLTFLINFFLGFAILVTNWKNEAIIKDANLWGILTLILFGPISSLIFVARAKNFNSLTSVE